MYIYIYILLYYIILYIILYYICHIYIYYYIVLYYIILYCIILYCIILYYILYIIILYISCKCIIQGKWWTFARFEGPIREKHAIIHKKNTSVHVPQPKKNRSPNLQDSNLQDYVGLFESRVPHEIWWFIKLITVFPIPNLLFGDFRGYAPLLFDTAICHLGHSY